MINDHDDDDDEATEVAGCLVQSRFTTSSRETEWVYCELRNPQEGEIITQKTRKIKPLSAKQVKVGK